jgi:hypothetical protein
LALISVPIIVFLHLFRRNPVVRRVSSLLLWKQKGEKFSTGRKRRPLQKSLSFWLELFAAVTLSIAIAQPQGCSSALQTHDVVVIDSSASMNSNGYWSEIQDVIAKDIRASKANSQWTLIKAGAEPTIIAGPKVTKPQALSTLERLVPYGADSNLDRAIELAETITSGSIQLYTDHPPKEAPPEHLKWYSSANSENNVGIIKAKWAGPQIEISLWNASDKPSTGELRLAYSKDQQEKKTLSFTANEIKHLNISRAKTSLSVQFYPNEHDGLSHDNNVYLLSPESRELKIAIDMEKGMSQSLGFTSSNGTAPLLKIAESVSVGSPMNADLLFTDRNIGGNSDTWRLSVHSSPKQIQLGQNDLFINQRHPLLQDVQLNNVIWNYSSAIQLRGKALIQHNSTPLLTEEIQNKGKRKIYHLNITPTRSTLHLHYSWPIFLSKILEARRDMLPGLVDSNLNPDDSIQILEAPSGTWTITTPSRTYQRKHNTGTLQVPADEIGLYQLALNEKRHEVSINLLSQAETDLRNRGSFHQSTPKTVATLSTESSSLASLFILLALLIMAWDWKVTEGQR